MMNPSKHKVAVRTATISAVVLLLLTSAWAAQQAGILFPNMTPTKGTFKEPAGEIGKKTKQPWSVTTGMWRQIGGIRAIRAPLGPMPVG